VAAFLLVKLSLMLLQCACLPPGRHHMQSLLLLVSKPLKEIGFRSSTAAVVLVIAVHGYLVV
jgi:hypothetical protein